MDQGFHSTVFIVNYNKIKLSFLTTLYPLFWINHAVKPDDWEFKMDIAEASSQVESLESSKC